MMKKLLTIFCMLVFFTSCMDEKKNENTDAEELETVEPKDELGTSPMDQPIEQEKNYSTDEPGDNTESRNPEKSNSSISNATYINLEHQNDTGCGCYCIEVIKNGSSELCLVEDKMYINAKFVQEANKIDIYYAGRSSNTTSNDLPWDKFGKDIPIAVLNPTGDGNFKLDWKGFTIDGELAVDYAIYGKKTLEGTYKKK